MLAGHPQHAPAGKVRDAATEWSSYSGDKASSKYSPLAQIGGDNFNRLTVAWTWRSAEEVRHDGSAAAQRERRHIGGYGSWAGCDLNEL